MEVRGERECTECGTRWSYFETGAIACPHCGSLRSVGSGSRRTHTDSPVTLDLTDVIVDIESRPLEALLADAVSVCREYVRQRGFIAAGDLRELDEQYVAALEIRHVGGLVSTQRSLADDERYYVLSLLRDADEGTRPEASIVPTTLRAGRGLAVSRAVTDYRRDVVEWASGRSIASPTGTAIETLGDYATRLDQLEGDVDPETADTLLSIARSLGAAVRRGDDAAAADVPDRLDALSFRA